MSDFTDKISGKAKEMAGKALHNRRLEARGKIQHGMADMRQRAKEAMDDLRNDM